PAESGSSVHASVQSQSASNIPALHGFCEGLPVQTPLLHASEPVHTRPSVHADPSGSAAVHEPAASSQDSEQLPSPLGPGHGSPACVVHAPAAQVSAPLQNEPSSQVLPSGSFAAQSFASSSQLSA